MSFASQVRATNAFNVQNRKNLYPLANHDFVLASLWPTTLLHWPASGQLSFCIGQPLANYPFALASLWPTIFLHWPASGQWFYMDNLLRNAPNDGMQ